MKESEQHRLVTYIQKLILEIDDLEVKLSIARAKIQYEFGNLPYQIRGRTKEKRKCHYCGRSYRCIILVSGNGRFFANPSCVSKMLLKDKYRMIKSNHIVQVADGIEKHIKLYKRYESLSKIDNLPKAHKHPSYWGLIVEWALLFECANISSIITREEFVQEVELRNDN